MPLPLSLSRSLALAGGMKVKATGNQHCLPPSLFEAFLCEAERFHVSLVTHTHRCAQCNGCDLKEDILGVVLVALAIATGMPIGVFLTSTKCQ